jgi:hypothetical protein
MSSFLLTVMFIYKMVEIQLFLRQLIRELTMKCHIQYLHRVCTRLVFCVNGQNCIYTHRKKKKESFEILSSRNWMPHLDTECTFIPKNENNFIKFIVQRAVSSYTRTKPYIKQSFFFLWRCDPTRVTASSFLRFLDHIQRRTTVGRTPLEK